MPKNSEPRKLTSQELEKLIVSKKEELRALRSGIKQLIEEKDARESEEHEEERKARIEAALKKIPAPWSGLIKSGFTEREVIALQNLDATGAALSQLLGVCKGYALQLRAKALRKMRHPLRRALAEKLGLDAQTIAKKLEANRTRPDIDMTKVMAAVKALSRPR